MKIGILALQGAVREHMRMFANLGFETEAIKRVSQLDDMDGLAIPGGESTAIGRIMRQYGFIEPLMDKIQSGFPVFGTCAGLIILARHIEGEEHAHLGVMDMTVRRNAFGRQRESFETTLAVDGIGDNYRAVFIRAPLILHVGEHVQVLARHNDEIVAARQQNMLAASFHPELTEDDRLHQYFGEMVQEYSQSSQTV